jgi:uncharacterized membrane protein YfcA
MILLGYALAALIGLSLGLLGGGGSILTVPVFVYVLRYDPKLAIAMSLPVVGATSLVGAVAHWRAGNVRLETAALFGVAAMIAAYIGARLASFLTGAVQLSLLAVIMVIAAISMFRNARRAPAPATPNTRGGSLASLRLLVPVALVVGLITGIVGIGGGFLIVPALVLLGGVPMKQAVGTSLLVIAMNCASGFVGYIGRVDIPWAFVLAFIAVAAIGILVGTVLARRVPQRALKQAFAVFLIVMGTFILVQNRRAFTADRTIPSSRGAAR